MVLNNIFSISPTPAIALHRLKINLPALLVIYVAFHADLYRWLSRDVMASLGRTLLGFSRESTKYAIWWLERIPYTILIFNIIHATISLLKLQSTPPAAPPPSRIYQSAIEPTKITTPQNRAYIPSPSGKDRPGLGRPSTPLSLRLRSSPISSAASTQPNNQQLAPNTSAANGPNAISQQPAQTPIKSLNQNPSSSHQTTSPSKPSSPTLNDLLVASEEKHRDRVARVQASSKFLSSSTGSPLSRSVVGADLGILGSPSLKQSMRGGGR